MAKRFDEDDDKRNDKPVEKPDHKPTPTPPIVVDPKPEPPKPDQELPKPDRDRRVKPEQLPAAATLPGYEQLEPLQEVTLQGGGPNDGQWQVGVDDKGAIPMSLAASGVTYDLSDRAGKIYNVRVK